MISIAAIAHTIILLGALQGIITGSLLFFARPHRQSNKILSILIWLMALASLNLYLEYTGWYYSSTTIAISHALVPMTYIMLMGPLIYFYIRSLIEPDFKITKKRWLHFLPVIIDFMPALIVMVFLAGTAAGYFKAGPRAWGVFIDQYNVYSDIPRWISLACYVWLSAKYLKSIKDSNGNDKAAIFKWMKQFTRIFMVFLIIWFLYLIPYVIPRYTDKVLAELKWYPVYLPLAIMIYWLGIKGYIILYQQNMILKKKADNLSSLPPGITEKAILLLTKSMEEDKIYLKPDLSLPLLSQYTGLPQKTISVVLNQRLNKTFNEFVNQYRVEALKRKLQEEEMGNLTITGIALECGFNSKATFQRTFKEFTGVSPSEYQKSIHKTSQ